MLDGGTILVRDAGAIDVRVGGALVLHDADSGRYVKLNRTAAELWVWLRDQATFQELSARFAARHRIDIGRARSDLAPALERLIERGLIDVIASAPSGREQHTAPREAVDDGDGIVA